MLPCPVLSFTKYPGTLAPQSHQQWLSLAFVGRAAVFERENDRRTVNSAVANCAHDGVNHKGPGLGNQGGVGCPLCCRVPGSGMSRIRGQGHSLLLGPGAVAGTPPRRTGPLQWARDLGSPQRPVGLWPSRALTRTAADGAPGCPSTHTSGPVYPPPLCLAHPHSLCLTRSCPAAADPEFGDDAGLQSQRTPAGAAESPS